MYSFPILKVSEILQCLNELNIPAQDTDITKPQAATVRVMYESFCELLTGFNAEEQGQPQFAAMEVMEYPELHENSVAEMMFNRSLMKLMSTVGLNDFSLRDLVKPEPKRTRRNLSALINFAKFREERLAKYQEFTVQTDELIENQAQLQETNAELTATVRQLRQQRQSEEPQVAALKSETDSLAAEIAKLNEYQASLQNEIRALKSEGGALNDKLNNDKFELMNARQENTRLRAQVVTEPEKLQQHIAELGTQVEAQRKAVVADEHRVLDFQAKLDALHKVDKDIVKATASMEECEGEKSKAKEVKKEVKEVQHKTQENERKMREFSSHEQYLQRQHAHTEEKLERITKQIEMKEMTARQSLSAAKTEQVQTQSTTQEVGAQLDKENQMIGQLHQKIADTKTMHAQDVERVRTQRAELESQVKEYHTQLFAQLQPVA